MFGNPNLKSLLGCSAVLLLMLSAFVQRELHELNPGDDGPPVDFAVYYLAGSTARAQGDKRLYFPTVGADKKTPSLNILLDPVEPTSTWAKAGRALGLKSVLAFQYPPFAALLMRPFSIFSLPISLLAWRMLSLLMLLASIYLALAMAAPSVSPAVFVMAVAGAFAFQPFIETLYQGQVDALILLVWCLGIFLVQRKRPVASAFCFAVGTMVKVTPALAVGLFLLRRQWKWLFAYTLWMAGLLGISVWQLGWQNHVVWFREVLPRLSCGVAQYGNRSLAAIVMNISIGRVPFADVGQMPAAAVCWFNKILSLGLYGGTLFYFWKRNRLANALDYELVIVALLTLLTSPVSWRHHYLLLVLPLLYFWQKSGESEHGWFAIQSLAVAIAALLAGSMFADDIAFTLRWPLLDLPLIALMPLAALFLGGVSLWLYQRAVPGAGEASSRTPEGEVRALQNI